MWKVPVWGMTFQLPQQTLIIRIVSQGEFTKCSRFQISHLLVTVEFTDLCCGYLQLNLPVTCENIKCYSNIQIITWMKSNNFFNNLLSLALSLPCVTKTEFLLTISIQYQADK